MAQSAIGIAVCDHDFTIRFSNGAINRFIGSLESCLPSKLDAPQGFTLLRLLEVDDVAAVLLALKNVGCWQGDTAQGTLHIAVERFGQDDTAGGWLITARALAKFGPARISERELISLSAKLTRREREVMLALEEGVSNKAIALRLGISPRTVEFHRAKIMRRFDARSIVDLVRKVAADARSSGRPGKTAEADQYR